MPERIGSLSAYKALIQLYRYYVLQNKRVLKSELNGKLRALQRKSEKSFLGGEFREVFVRSLEQMM